MNILEMLNKAYSKIVRVNDKEIDNIFYVGGSENLPAPLPPEEEEQEIIKLDQGDENAKKKLVEHNLRLVVYIAKKFENTGVGIEDLVSIGTIGLMKAIDHFDVTLNVKFSTYAYYYVLGEITKFIRESKTVKLSKEMVKLNRSINKAVDVMTQKLGREPTSLELSLFLDIEEEKINDVLLATQEVQSLDYSYDEDSNDLYNIISSENSNVDLEIDLKDELKRLNPEERELILQRYFNNLTQTEVSRETGMSQVQISRKETKILQKLKQRL